MYLHRGINTRDYRSPSQTLHAIALDAILHENTVKLILIMAAVNQEINVEGDTTTPPGQM